MTPVPRKVPLLCCAAALLGSALGLRLQREGGQPISPAASEKQRKQDIYTERRLSDLLTPTVGNESCGGFEERGHYCEQSECNYERAWCISALNETLKRNPVGLSFGVYNFDGFSRELSNFHGVRTELYDCYYTGKTHPIKHNYTVPYRRHDTCLAAEEHTDGDGRKFETLPQQLNGRGPLSTLVKIDIEGWEWQVLEDMNSKHPEEFDKIALLDLELHFCQHMEKANKTEDDGIAMHPATQIPILEDLLEHFAVNYFAKLEWNAYTDSFDGCPGAPGTMANVNLVNRKLVTL